MAPIEEFVFHRETRTCYATRHVPLCGMRGSKLTGVRRVDAVAIPAPSSHIYGLPMHPPADQAQAQANGALRLAVVHEHGRAVSINMWPISESRRLHRAINALNIFLRTYNNRGQACRFKLRSSIRPTLPPPLPQTPP